LKDKPLQENYMLGVNYFRENEAKIGVGIFVKNDLKFKQTDIKHQFSEQDIECYVVPLESELSN
jgi:hypothetical protein